MPEEDARHDLARKIIELSDLISEHSKKLTEEGFIPTEEYVAETRRLTKLCRDLTAEADTAHEKQEDDLPT